MAIDVISGTSENDVLDHSSSSGGSINGGQGDDSIVCANRATVVGGLGNDTIQTGGYCVVQYSKGDGDDVIIGIEDDSEPRYRWKFGHRETDTIQLMDASINNISVSCNDVIMYIESGSIKFKNSKIRL